VASIPSRCPSDCHDSLPGRRQEQYQCPFSVLLLSLRSPEGVLGERLLLQDCAIVSLCVARVHLPGIWERGQRREERRAESQRRPLCYCIVLCSALLVSCFPAFLSSCWLLFLLCILFSWPSIVLRSLPPPTTAPRTSVPPYQPAVQPLQTEGGFGEANDPSSLVAFSQGGSHASAANPEDEPCSAAVDTALARGSVCRTPLPGPGCCMAGCRLAAEALQRHNGGGSPTSMALTN
jgi:hypothetical protein